MAYLMLAEKNPANKPLIGRTERKLNQLQRQGIRPRNPDAQSFSLAEDGRPPADSGFPPPSEFDRQPEPPQGFPPPRR